MGKVDLKGKIFGGLEVVGEAEPKKMPSGQTATCWQCRCLKCGSVRTYFATSLKRDLKDCGCSRNKPIEVGRTYGNITILSAEEKKDRRTAQFRCRCERCGTVFVDTAQGIYLHQDGGCVECRKERKWEAKLCDLKQKYVGKEYGSLEILDISLRNTRKGRYTVRTAFALCRCVCGTEKEIPLDRILDGAALTCGHDTRKNLGIGHDLAAKAAVGGTSVLCIMPGRKLNKNSSTGRTGVCELKDGKYRAYINFQRRQYNLGVYDDLESAVKARKSAEQEIFGDFLSWYAQTFPEIWERIRRKES